MLDQMIIIRQGIIVSHWISDCKYSVVFHSLGALGWFQLSFRIWNKINTMARDETLLSFLLAKWDFFYTKKEYSGGIAIKRSLIVPYFVSRAILCHDYRE